MIWNNGNSAKIFLIGAFVTMLVIFLLLLFNSYFAEAISGKNGPPHIIFILADDLGWNDVSFHGSPQIPTPNIDALAASGIILNRHYTAPQCTPSRASLMTGKYPSNTGLQHFVIEATSPTGLPLEFTIMPQYFKGLGYATHLIGKWHLGFHKKEYTPTYRGFDSFLGNWNGVIDYFDHTNYESETAWGIDLHNGTEPVKNLRGQYLVDILTERAEEIITEHNPSQPLLLLLSQVAPHTGNSYQRLQALPKHVARFKHIKDARRRIYAGAISALDDSVGRVFSALYEKGILDNSIILFMSDNGGEATGHRGAQGSNWPLRGSKLHLWEGGVRTPALIWSPLLRLKEPRTSVQMMHISDWLPTLYTAAGGNIQDLGDIDGINFWQHLKYNFPFHRTEILLNVDPILGMSSLIQGDYKLVSGTYRDKRDSWYGPFGQEDISAPSMDEWVWKNGSIVKDILQSTGRWLLEVPDKWRLDATVDCGSKYCAFGGGICDPQLYPCLFNIVEDPCEYFNLASQMPEMVRSMERRIHELNSTSVGPVFNEPDPKGDPRCHGFAYVTWQDEEHQGECYELWHGDGQQSID